MLVDDAIERRHSTIEFSTRYVLSEQLTRIVTKALKVPSFNGRYNFKVVILTHDSIKKDSIGKALKKYGKDNFDPVALTQGDCIKKASSLILIYKTKTHINRDRENDDITAGALGQNICLLATNYYLGTLWIDRVKNIKDKINKIIKKYSDMELCYGIIIGYRDNKYSYLKDTAPNSKVDWFVE